MWCSLQQKTPRRMQGQRSPHAMVVALKVISRNVARSQVTSQKIILTDRISLPPQVSGKMNFASTLPQTEADFFDEQGLLKEYRPPVQTAAAAAVPADGWYVCTEKDSNNSEFSFRVSSRSSSSFQSLLQIFPFQEFPLTEVVNSISNRFLQHFQIRWI